MSKNHRDAPGDSEGHAASRDGRPWRSVRGSAMRGEHRMAPGSPSRLSHSSNDSSRDNLYQSDMSFLSSDDEDMFSCRVEFEMGGKDFTSHGRRGPGRNHGGGIAGRSLKWRIMLMLFSVASVFQLFLQLKYFPVDRIGVEIEEINKEVNKARLHDYGQRLEQLSGLQPQQHQKDDEEEEEQRQYQLQLQIQTLQSQLDQLRLDHEEQKKKIQSQPEQHQKEEATEKSPLETKQREVKFLSIAPIYEDSKNTHLQTKKDFILQDAFSASWWQSKERFLEYTAVENITPSPEGASFEVFFQTGPRNIRVTKDWMDLSVEHMSKWWKTVLHPIKNNGPDLEAYANRILKIFRTYVKSDDRRMFWESVANDPDQAEWREVSQSTIAVIAFMSDSGVKGRDIIKSSLASTILSLQQLGVGRIIVSGADEEDETIVRKAFEIVSRATKDWDPEKKKLTTELEFCLSADARTGDDSTGLNIPKAALKQLRHVFLKQTPESVTSCWMGAGGEERWKYVFLGEPDLLLTTRPTSTQALARELKEGKVLAPHRLQPMPHSADFLTVKTGDGQPRQDGIHMLPHTLPAFDRIVEGDHIESDWSCCDAGNKKPKHDYEQCGVFWWTCGFVELRDDWDDDDDSRDDDAIANKGNDDSITEAHKIISSYPLIRLKRGTGVVFVGSEIGRTCRPQPGPCE